MRRYVGALAVVGLLLTAPVVASAAVALYGNSNPMCYFLTRYSMEWYIMFCNLTEDPPGSEG